MRYPLSRMAARDPCVFEPPDDGAVTRPNWACCIGCAPPLRCEHNCVSTIVPGSLQKHQFKHDMREEGNMYGEQARQPERHDKYLTGPLAGGARRGCCGAEAEIMYGEAGTG